MRRVWEGATMEIVTQSIKTPQKMSQFQVFANPGRKGNVCAGDAETDTITRMMMMYSLSRNASLMSIVGPVGRLPSQVLIV